MDPIFNIVTAVSILLSGPIFGPLGNFDVVVSKTVKFVDSAFVNGVFEPDSVFGEIKISDSISGGLTIKGRESGGNPQGALKLEGFSNTDGAVGPAIVMSASQIGNYELGNIVSYEPHMPLFEIQNNADSQHPIFQVQGDGGVVFQGQQHQKFGEDLQAKNLLEPHRSGNIYFVHGNDTIKHIDNEYVMRRKGDQITLIFKGSPKIEHNEPAIFWGAPILLGGSIDLHITPNTVLTFVYDGQFWREISRIIP